MRCIPPYIKIATAILAVAVLLPGPARGDGEGDGVVTDQVAAAAATAADNAKAAGQCVEVSLAAVENAMAAEDDVQSVLIKAMRAGDQDGMLAAEKNLKAAAEAEEQAREMAKEVMDHSAECASAAAAAKDEAKKQRQQMTDRESASLEKRMDRLAETAVQALGKAQTVTDSLKKKWLLPVIPQSLPSTNAVPLPSQPLSSVRADRW